MSKKLNRIIDTLSNIITGIVVVKLSAATLLVVIQAILRYLFLVNYEWVEELTRYLCISAAFMASGPMVVSGGHVTLEVFVAKFTHNPLFKLIYELVSTIFTGFVSFFLLLWGWKGVNVFGMYKTASLQFPAWLPYSLLPVSMGIVILFSLLNITRLLTGWKEGKA